MIDVLRPSPETVAMGEAVARSPPGFHLAWESHSRMRPAGSGVLRCCGPGSGKSEAHPEAHSEDEEGTGQREYSIP